ncbi:MAG: GDSL family lipase [Bacteroidetes bacterium]|nr:GDSL family lipase [Bacteroidota bacterium]
MKNRKKVKKYFSLLSLIIFAALSLNFMVEKTPTVYLIGDSTMSDKPLVDNPERGWGMTFPYYFSKDLKIENHAKNGRSTKNFLSEGRWQVVLDKLQPGDYIFIQFGHNDAKESDPNRYAPAHTLYKENLNKYVSETREKGAIPVLLTPVMRRRFDKDGKFYDVHGDYPTVVKEVAKELGVQLIDLHEKSRKLFVEYGEEKTKELFLWIEPGVYDSLPEGKTDNTHFTIKGAYLVAGLVRDGIKELGLPLEKWMNNNSGIGLLNDKNILGVVNDDKSRGDISVFEIELPQFPDKDFNVVDFGAVGDGITLNSEAFSKAIDACTNAGGGRVVVPMGMWLTGPITLQDNVNLFVDKGAHLQFTRNFDDYPLVESDWEGTAQWRCQSPISGRHLKNIAITGSGIIDGAGDAWRLTRKDKLTSNQWKELLASGGVTDDKEKTWWPSAEAREGFSYLKKFQDPAFSMSLEDAKKIKDYFRPVLLSLMYCKNVLLDGPTFQNSPAWNLHPLGCEGLIVRNVTVKNPWYSQNGDGIDIESCKNSVVYNCNFDVGDDAVCIKSGRDEYGRNRGLATENLVMKDCIVYHAHGGFTIGSEMSGGARNIKVTGCNFIGTDIGLRFKSLRGRGGVIENIFIDNIYMKDIPTRAISFNMFYGGKGPMEAFSGEDETAVEEEVPVNEGTPIFRKIYMDEIFCDGAEDALILQGLPELAIEDIFVSNSVMRSKRAVIILDADGISISNSKFIPEESPVFMVSQSKNISLDNIEFSDSEDFIQIAGEKCKNISITNSNVDVKEMVKYTSGATEESLNR